MNTKRLPVHFLVASTLASSLLIAPPAFSANKCALLFGEEQALIALKLGVRQTGKESRPLGIQVVESRYKIVEDTINGIATWAFGKTLKLDEINKIAKAFLADTSADPYFVRLARAFEMRYSVDEAALAKNIPATGGGMIVLNHPRNGKDGIATAAAIAKIRPDAKVVMTLFLENVPGMHENAIFLNPYGGAKAREFNASRLKQMEEHIRQGGLIVIFASGEVSVKTPGSDLKPVDPDWKLGVARMLRAVPDAFVIPTYMGGEASSAFYKVRAKGLGLKTTVFHVRELADRSERDFPISFAAPIAGKDLLEDFGSDGKGMMNYLRSRTYLMNEQTSLQAKNEVKKDLPEKLLPETAPEIVHADIAKTGTLVFADPKKAINVYAVDGKTMSTEVWHELGIARANSFAAVGEGNGKMDIDSYDRHYVHIIAVDTNNHKILGAYRVGRVDEIVAEKGVKGLYSSNFFENSALISAKGGQMLELGRSFVDFDAGSKAILALDRLWKGVTGYISLHPHYRYMIGPVSISNAYSTTSKLLILSYLKKQMDPEMSKLIHGRTPIEFSSQFQAEIDVVAARVPDLKELNKLVVSLDGNAIPPLLTSYGKLGAKYMAFDRDKEFNTVDGLIIVDLLSKDAKEEASKHFGDNWNAYLESNGMSPE